jgi:hypothetical protein
VVPQEDSNMNTYIKTPAGTFAVRASRTQVNKLAGVISGEMVIIPATAALRKAAARNIIVKTLRILSDGRLGAL